jgi:hypothetical protein
VAYLVKQTLIVFKRCQIRKFLKFRGFQICNYTLCCQVIAKGFTKVTAVKHIWAHAATWQQKLAPDLS